MGKYLEIADKALREMSEQPARPIKPSALHYEKNEVNELSSDPELRAFAFASDTAAQIQRGEIPDHYTATTDCRSCGTVPIFPGLPLKVDGCPWCLNRVDGRPVPRAK